MGSLCGFGALHGLHTETQLLLREADMSYDETSLARALPPKLETLELECSRLEEGKQIGKSISALAKLKAKFVPALRKVEGLTRNDVEDFETVYYIYDD